MSSPRFSLLQQGQRSGFLGRVHQLPGGYKEGIHPLQYCKVISLQLIKINEKKIKKKKKRRHTPLARKDAYGSGESPVRDELSCSPSQPRHPICPTCQPRPQPPLCYLLALQGLVDGEAPVVVHSEQDDFACVVEPGGSGHVHPPLPGGHDRCDCVPCRGRKQAGLWPRGLADLARAWRHGWAAARRAFRAG